MLFLGSPRSALVVAITIPLALASILILMNAAHMSASMLSLGALDFGVIVDGAIVVTENILRRRESKPTEELTEEDIRSATLQVARPIFFATLIIVSAYLPLFTLQRGEAALFTPMAYTVGFALFGALLCTLALTPGLAYLALRKPRAAFRNRPLEWLTRGYRNLLGKLLNWPSLAYLATGSRLRRGRDARQPGRAGLPARPRRGRAVAAGAASQRAVPRSRQRNGERAAPDHPGVSRGIVCRHPARPRGRRGRCLDAVAHRGSGRADALRHLAQGRNQGRLRAQAQRSPASELPGINVGINQPISDMVYDLDRRGPQPAGHPGGRRRFQGRSPDRWARSSTSCATLAAPRRRPSSRSRRCLRSPSRPTGRRPRATASMFPTSRA